MTTLVRLDEWDGLVTRREDTNDGRATCVWLTNLTVELDPLAADLVDELQWRLRLRCEPLADEAIRAFNLASAWLSG